MSEEDKVTEVADTVSNGTAAPEKTGETATENKADDNDGIKEMEEDGEDDNHVEKMDVDKPEVKHSKVSKEEEEQEEKDRKKELEKEEPKSEAEEEKRDALEDENGEHKFDEKLGASKEENDKPEEDKEEKDPKKHAKAKSTGKKDKKKEVKKKKEEPKTPLVSSIDRPVRERKSVERLVASIEKEAVREFHIEKGRGTALKDIPNVAYKLSKRKTDDTFKTLHTILFGRRGKATQIRSNISRFSGFVWHENEEKQRMKVKEKLDKCVKEKLLDFCDVLDIPIAKSTTKKEDIVTKLIDFMVVPHATTTELLAEMEQSSKVKKRKRVSKGSASTSGKPSKRFVKSRGTGNATKGERKKVTAQMDDDSEQEEEGEEEEEEHEMENVNGVPESSDDEMPEHDENEEKVSESEDESEEETKRQKRSSKRSSVKKESTEKVRMKKDTTPKKSSPKPKKTRMKSRSGLLKVNSNSDTSQKMLSGKKKNEIVSKKKSSTPEKPAPKEKSGKKVVKGKNKPKEEKVKPSDEELRNAIREILKEVDFNTATFTDILKQLAKQFNADLTPRKSSIKLMIQDELTKLADEAEDEEDEVDAEKDGKQASGQGVEA